MALCAACRKISVSALVCELSNVPSWWEKLNSRSKPRGMVHHNDARQLRVSVEAGCPLCLLIRDSLFQFNGRQDSYADGEEQGSRTKTQIGSDLERYLIDSPIYLRPNFDPLKCAFPQDGVLNAPYVRGFKVFVPLHKDILVGQVRLFALRDTPASLSCDVVGRPPLLRSDSPEAFDLVRRWMRRCLSEHTACRETCSGGTINESEPPFLPTRVIHVRGLDHGDSPRLLETKGQKGHYVALSHCWGRNKPPLMTTQSTLRRHIAGIPWDEIPKLYQDAITATRLLGLEWLWIDSLCILQDLPSDWLSESKRMGTVYENARLTIAASHASDSSQPCFFPRPQPPVSVELPYLSRTGEYEGSIFATHMPTDYASITPESSALDSRAWATQEWLLSRRMIFYTSESLVWSCKSISQRETGGSFHSTARNPRWKAIVEKYSARSLTHATDRLIALEGIRTEMGKRRTNDTYCFGLWRYDMPELLLWYSREPAERVRSPLKLPTWSWASTLHGVRFIVMKQARNGCGGIKFDEAQQTLIVRGFLRKATINPYDTLERDHRLTAAASFPPLADMLEHEIPSSMMCAISLQPEGISGKAVLDEGVSAASTDIFCLQLMVGRLAVSAEDGTKRKYHQQWVLLLRRLDDSAELYVRVGAGLIVTAAPAFTNHSPTAIYIQ